MTAPVVLFRSDHHSVEELEVCDQYFDTYDLRSRCPPNSLVIGRYSCLPYYDELDRDLRCAGSRLINTPAQHHWIANFDYYDTVRNYTPKSYTNNNFYTCQYPGPFVIKGRTNSRKSAWKRLMFARTKIDALLKACDLTDDPEIASQGVIYREFIEFKNFGHDLSGVPITNEWRFFCYKQTVLSWGFYWANLDEIPAGAEIDQAGHDFVRMLTTLVSPHVNAYVLDIAQKPDGSWMLVEINDLQQSGLSWNDPHTFYKNLKAALETDRG